MEGDLPAEHCHFSGDEDACIHWLHKVRLEQVGVASYHGVAYGTTDDPVVSVYPGIHLLPCMAAARQSEQELVKMRSRSK